MNFVLHQLQNGFVSGGLLLMITGSLMALARQMPSRLWAWVKRRGSISITVPQSDPLFGWTVEWLAEQPYAKRARSLIATTRSDVADESPRARVRVLFSPSKGSHFLSFNGTFVWLSRTSESAKPGGAPVSSSDAAMSFERESFVITVLGKSQKVGRELVAEIVTFGTKPSEEINLFRSSFGWWQSSRQIAPRRLDSVILPRGAAESILDDLVEFLRSENWYRSIGIPWHRGYLLHGTPGTGKSSLVVALAGELKMNLYLLNVSGAGMSDEKLSNLMSEVRGGSIVLMEDVDCTFPDREKSDKDRVTLSGLLNVLDGVSSREGCVVFMTTNHASRLDPALARPGRVDKKIEFSSATRDQIDRLAARIAPGFDWRRTELAAGERSMAEVQQFLLDRRTKGTTATP